MTGCAQPFDGCSTAFAARVRARAAKPRPSASGSSSGVCRFYGFHLLLCWITGWLFGLNRLKIYLAANISNPLIAPLLIFTELQTGAWVRRGAFHALTLQTARTTDLSVFGLDILTGSLTLGATLGCGLALVTYLSVRGPRTMRFFSIWYATRRIGTSRRASSPGSSRGASCAATRCIDRRSAARCCLQAERWWISAAAVG